MGVSKTQGKQDYLGAYRNCVYNAVYFLECFRKIVLVSLLHKNNLSKINSVQQAVAGSRNGLWQRRAGWFLLSAMCLLPEGKQCTFCAFEQHESFCRVAYSTAGN